MEKYMNENVAKDGFFNDVFVKTNVAEVLDKELSKKSWSKNNLLNISGVTDCYQPLEAKYQLMPKVLEVLIKHKQPTTFITKSSLIMRDFELIKKLSEVTYVNVSASVTIMDEAIRKKLEPGAAPCIDRLNALGEFAKLKGCGTTVMLMPIIPYLTDKTDNIETIFKIASSLKVNQLLSAPVNLRGENKKNFYAFLRNDFPETYEKIQKLYYGAYASKDYSSRLRDFIWKMKNKYKLYGYKDPDREIIRMNEKNNMGRQLDLFLDIID